MDQLKNMEAEPQQIAKAALSAFAWRSGENKTNEAKAL